MSSYMDPLTIGEFLTEEFLKPLNISAYRLAKDIRVPVSRIQEILNDERAITIDTGLRLSHYFGMNEMFFIDLQAKVTFDKERIKVLKEIEGLPTYKELEQQKDHP
jgi:addiction module HigA family antidote